MRPGRALAMAAAAGGLVLAVAIVGLVLVGAFA